MIRIVIIRIEPKEDEPEVRKLPLVLPGSIIVLPSEKMYFVKYIGIDGHGMGPMYVCEDIEMPEYAGGKLELIHEFLEKFGHREIIPPGIWANALRGYYGQKHG